ncbi:HalOD1 output domain-containing protein [Halorarum salinum]|uniref:Halobacterial output domain-containing protein n=1 Tax=Halorarum salinum TaxID=2743089 RepID=A0A7D5LCT8_9EURY|nr:HalOD1 output domain-containing protein [Halobaculum salinum]QLG62935.1 hypothetical protein HUG12_14830 [Halobaculum salinum]
MTTPSTRVVEAVAEFRDVDPAELPPLYDVVDPDALDALFDSTGTSSSRREGTVEFVYAGIFVRVDASGGVELTSAADPE